MSGATVVSAYYYIAASRNSAADYKKWMRLFFETVPCHLVFFCEHELVEFVTECRAAYMDRTRIIVLPRSEWIATTKFSDDFWLRQFYKDPEMAIHSEDMYKVWYEKKEFVARAIRMNPFGHEYFVWADAGILREARLAISFPLVERIPAKKMLLLLIDKFYPEHVTPVSYNGVMLRGYDSGDHVGGGVIAGTATNWAKWNQAYDAVFDKYVCAGLFCGREERVMNSVCLEYRRLVHFFHSVSRDRWRDLFFHLGSK
jgi:hypothetical protein